jgi:Ca2+-binding EF-hand superfamily protein
MVGEEGQPLEEKKELIPPETLEDMRNIWSVFDLECKDQVSVIELRTILRALDLDLGDEELQMITKQIDPERNGFFSYGKLKEVMEEKLRDVDTMEDLLE